LFSAPDGDWSNMAERAWHANEAMSLWSYNDAPLLQKAFQEYGLDPVNPWNWRGLFMTFAAAHYGIKPKGGRPLEWTAGEIRRFITDYKDAVAVLRKEDKKLTRSNIAEQMKTNHPRRYPQEVDTLVKLISKIGIKPGG
jgi:hypothetical protein